MRLTQSKIEEIVLPILSQEGLILIKYLYSKENVSEFDLSKKTKLDIKIVRKMLYLLYNHNLVGFNRKKDKEKGWYIYYWTLLPENVKFAYFKRRTETLAKLKYRLEVEKKELFFVCPKGCVRINLDQGLDFEFHCSECGDLLDQDDNQKIVAGLERRIQEIEAELEEYKEKKKEKKVAGKERKKVVKQKIKEKKPAPKKSIDKRAVKIKDITKKVKVIKQKKPATKTTKKKKVDVVKDKTKNKSKKKK